MTTQEQRKRVKEARIWAENASWRMGPSRRATLANEEAKLAAMIEQEKNQ